MSLAKLQDLKGRVALVTGGSRGLGLQIAEVLGELGAKVAITARKQDELDAAAKHLNSLGIEALPLVCDMSRLETIAPMVERAHFCARADRYPRQQCRHVVGRADHRTHDRGLEQGYQPQCDGDLHRHAGGGAPLHGAAAVRQGH